MFTTRRHFCTAAAGLALPFATAAREQPITKTLDLDTPADALTAMIKMRGSLVAEDVPWWYYGTIYGVLPGRAPVPMVDFEGSEIDYYARQPDGSYHAWAATVSMMKDRQTGKRIKYFDNPFTGKRNTVRANSISVNAYYIYTVNGAKRSDDPRPLGDEPNIHKQLEWRTSGDHIWLTMRRSYPPGVPMGEHQLVRGSLKELHDSSLAKVNATAAPTYIAPWLGWMDMKNHPGHTVWAGPARKLDTVKQYPRALLNFMEKEFPEKLTAKPE